VLPLDADASNIKAKCRNGLLTINIGKIKSKKIHITIQISGEESGTTTRGRITAWWTQLVDMAQRLLSRNAGKQMT
jgi:hypothetical protein